MTDNKKKAATKELMELATRVKNAADEKAWDDVEAHAREAIAAAEKSGLCASWVRWMLAIALDNGGKPDEALSPVEAAVEEDPSSAAAARSREIILDRMRGVVCDDEIVAARRMAAYRELATRGEASFPCHVAQVRLLTAAGRASEALTLARAAQALWAGNEEVDALVARLAGAAS